LLRTEKGISGQVHFVEVPAYLGGKGPVKVGKNIVTGSDGYR